MMPESTNVLDAMTAMRPARRGNKSQGMFLGILLVFFFVLLLVALSSGVTVYRNVANTQANSVDAKLGLSLISNLVRSTDAADAVASADGPEGKALVLVERIDSGTYETRIYLYHGSIVQEYALANAAYTPEKATELLASSVFEFSYENGVLSITTDQGTSHVALRSEQGSA